MSPKRGTVSITRAVYDRLHAYTSERGISMAGLVEELMEPVLAGVAMPEARAVPDPPRVPPPDRALLDRMAAARRASGSPAEMGARFSAAGRVKLDIPAHVSAALFDQQARAHSAGQEVEPGALFEAAIGRMLDALAALPWCRTCLESPEDCRCRARSAVGR